MREYGQIQSTFWQADDIADLSDQAKLLACYLLTGPHSNGIGCFRLTDGYLVDDLGWPAETVSERFAELFRKGFAYRSGRVVFIPNFLRWNRIANGNVAKARFAEWDALPKGELKSRAARAMLEFCGHWQPDHIKALETVSQTVTETPSTGYANQDPTRTNPDPEKEREKTPTQETLADLAPETRPVRGAVEIDTWLSSLGEADAIPADDPIFDYAQRTGIPRDFLELSWERFVEEMRTRRKRQKDWRAHYRNAVRNNWLKLWWFSPEGDCRLTTAGEQARRAAA